MNRDFYRRELDAINEKWRAIQHATNGQARALDYRLHIHPFMWEGMRKYLVTKLDAMLHNPRLGIRTGLLELRIVCDSSVESWLIVKAPQLPPILAERQRPLMIRPIHRYGSHGTRDEIPRWLRLLTCIIIVIVGDRLGVF